MGIGYFWLGSGDDNAANEARQAAVSQIEQERTEFQRQLAAAKQQAAAASQDSAKASEERIATLTSQVETLTDARDTAQKALADANAQIEAVKNAAGDEAKARISALEQKVA
jgi:septal ring factor EnvC (AmiA/AmiB activator)